MSYRGESEGGEKPVQRGEKPEWPPEKIRPTKRIKPKESKIMDELNEKVDKAKKTAHGDFLRKLADLCDEHMPPGIELVVTIR